jgi:ABC-type transport system substrate-binding protein
VEAVGGLEAALRNPKIGTGQYNFVEWVDGSHIMLTRNENYWGAPGYWKTIEVLFIPDHNSRSLALMSGDIDVAMNITYEQVIGISTDRNLQTIMSFANGVNTLYMNCSHPPLDDVRVREAIALLIDADAMIQVMTGGLSTVTDTMISSLTPLYLPRPASMGPREVNVARARQLLADAGHADGLTLRWLCNLLGRTQAELAQANLAAGGITLELDVLESATFLQYLRSGQYEMAQAGSFNHDPTRQLNRVDGRLTPTQAAGGAMYESEELNGYVDMARSTDPAVRLQGYHLVQQYVRDNFIVLGMFETIYYVGARGDLTNATFNSSGWMRFGSLRPS